MPAFLAAFASQDALKTRGNEGDFSGMREYSTWCYILQGGKQAQRGRRYLIRETNNAGPFYRSGTSGDVSHVPGIKMSDVERLADDFGLVA